VHIQTWLDTDGDLSTDADQGHAPRGWQFEVSLAGTDTVFAGATDARGWMDAAVWVFSAEAQIRITQVTDGWPLIGVTCTEPDGVRIDPPIDDRSVTLPIGYVDDGVWSCAFINAGAWTNDVGVFVQGTIDVDGDLATIDRTNATHLTYDVEVSGTATTDRSSIVIDDVPDPRSFKVTMSEATTLRITQRERPGLELLDALALTSDERRIGTLVGRTLVVDIHAGDETISTEFVNHAVDRIKPSETLPPTDALAAASAEATRSLAVVVIAIASIGLLAVRPTRGR
jgi:hypothetical protein